MRDIARSAGVTHPLVSRYFESKEGLVGAVGDRLTAHVTGEIDAAGCPGPEAFVELLRSARRDPSMTKLLIRSTLGDMSPDGFPACLGGEWLRSSAEVDSGSDRRARICQYAASSLLLGWLSFDGFMTSAVGLGDVSEPHRDPGDCRRRRASLESGDRGRACARAEAGHHRTGRPAPRRAA